MLIACQALINGNAYGAPSLNELLQDMHPPLHAGTSSHFPESTEAFLAVLQATSAGEHAAIAAAKADAFFTSSWCMEAFQLAHESWGLPWCASLPTCQCVYVCVYVYVCVCVCWEGGVCTHVSMLVCVHALVESKRFVCN